MKEKLTKDSYIVLVLVLLFLTFLNVLLSDFLNKSKFVFFIIFFVNVVAFNILLKIFTKRQINDVDITNITNKSVSVFIRVLIYLLPIVVLIGLYLLSYLQKGTVFLNLQEANSWVSFILAIAAFVMSLITLWQSEGTYNKIIEHLENIGKDTYHISKSLPKVMAKQDISLKSSDELINARNNNPQFFSSKENKSYKGITEQEDKEFEESDFDD